MAVPYQATDATKRLVQARTAVLACDNGLDSDNAKPLAYFQQDLRRLADLGSQLYLDVIGQLPNSYARTLRDVLNVPSLIQVSHTGPVPYAYPWPLLYDYILDADDSLWRSCEVVTKHWSRGSVPVTSPPCTCATGMFRRCPASCPERPWLLGTPPRD